MPQLTEELMKKVREMEIATGATESINLYDLKNYEPGHYYSRGRTGETVYENNNEELTRRLAEMMLYDRVGQNALANAFPDANNMAKDMQAEVSRVADLKGKAKRQEDFWGTKRRAARKRLEEIGKRRIAIEGRRINMEELEREQRERIKLSAPATRSGTRLMNSWMNRNGLGTHAERHKPVAYEEVTSYHDLSEEELAQRQAANPGRYVKKYETHKCVPTPKTFVTPQGVLKGATYVSKNYHSWDPTTKAVIVFTGTHSPSANQCASQINSYLSNEESVIVYCIDYRGFGQSETQKDGKKVGTPLSEDSIYRDGMEIYKAVLEENQQNIDGFCANNIILHGYSMGGAVASYVAAKVSEDAQKSIEERAAGGHPMQYQEAMDMRLGGLVLASPIATMREAAENTMGMKLAGTMGEIGCGAYNTREHLQVLAKADPNIPIHYTSGSADSDDLSIEKTRITQGTAFRRESRYVTPGQKHDESIGEQDAIKAMVRSDRMD